MSNGLFASLYTSTNALRAQSAALDITGRNMANVNNPAYARQRVVLGDKGSIDTPLGTQSLGVEPVAIQSMRDRLLDGQITGETSNLALLSSQRSYLQQAQTALGQGIFGDGSSVDTIGSNTELPAGIAASVDAFFNAWQSFATEPNSTVNKQQLIANTDDLVGKVRLADTRLAAISLPTTGSNTITGQMDEDVRQVNSLLTTLADLNRQIGRVEVVNPGTAVDLRDQRQAKIEELAKYMDFTTVPQSAGQIGIQVSDGGTGTVDLLNLSTVTGELVRNGSDYEWKPTTGANVPVAFSAGNLRGYQVAGASVQDYRDRLDDFVGKLIQQVNDAYTNAAGTPNTNGPFFAGTDAATFARDAGITVSNLYAGDKGGPSGANDRALAVANLAKDPNFDGGTPTQSFTRIVTKVAQDVSVNGTRTEDQETLRTLLTSQRDSYGGVSLDEETADMLRYQRAYQASAKMMTVVSELLDEVISSLAR